MFIRGRIIKEQFKYFRSRSRTRAYRSLSLRDRNTFDGSAGEE